MKTLYLVDVSSMFFRAYYAIPPLSTKAGQPTNALVGLVNMTVKLMKDEKPDYMVFCMDRKGPTFRNELYKDYKANRSDTPEDLIAQLPLIRPLTERMGIKPLDFEGYEADDVIGTLAKYGKSLGLKVVIVSGDKDFAQLIDDDTCMLDTMKNIRYTPEKVIEKWGIQPDQMVDYLAMVGDSSDNISGIKGVGPKGAQKLLGEHGTLDEIYNKVDSISGKSTKQKIIDGKESAYLAQKLVTIVTDIPLDFSINDLELKPIIKSELDEFLKELEFERFSQKLTGSKFQTAEKSTGQSKEQNSALTPEEEKFGTEEILPWQEQRWSLSDLEDKIESGSEIWAVLSHRGICLGVNNIAITVDADRTEIGKILSSKGLSWKGHDLKNIWTELNMSPSVGTPSWDSMLAAYTLRAGNIESFSQVSKLYMDYEIPEMVGPGFMVATHAAAEVILRKKLEETRGYTVLHDIELPLVPVLYRMERNGIRIDSDELAAQSKELEGVIQQLTTSIHKAAGEEFNIASPKQLGEILFVKMQLPKGKKTKPGYSKNVDVLNKLKDEYPICEEILDYRELAKLKSTYVDALPKIVNAETGRIHTQLRQAVTTTGRLSSTQPNLQNIPIRTERGRRVRKAFIPIEGSELLSVDYSQIELRVLAHITQDPGLCHAFENEIDIHSATASEVFSVPLEDLTSDLRRKAKAVNFGIAYGQGAFGLSESLGIPRSEAVDIIETYFKKFSKVREYMSETIERAQQQGYVETIFGRRRYIDELKSKNGNIRKFGERAAINAPIQGTASDIVKKAMIEVDKSVDCKILLQVHDELLFSCPTIQIEAQAQVIKEVMEGAVELSVPLRVNIAWGKNWEEAHA